MIYPIYIVNEAYRCLQAEEEGIDQTQEWQDLDLACSMYELLMGTNDPDFVSNWKHDLITQVEQVYGYHKPA